MGDMAYELEGNNGTVGDDYFRQIEKWASKVPYMVKTYVYFSKLIVDTR